jgi:hypothetical protein
MKNDNYAKKHSLSHSFGSVILDDEMCSLRTLLFQLSVLQVYRLFQCEFSTSCNLVLPL